MVSGQALFKLASLGMPSDASLVKILIYLLSKPEFIAALFIYFCAAILWIFIIAQINLSTAYATAVGLCVLLLSIIDFSFFKSTITPSTLVGYSFIVAGITISFSSIK